MFSSSARRPLQPYVDSERAPGGLVSPRPAPMSGHPLLEWVTREVQRLEGLDNRCAQLAARRILHEACASPKRDEALFPPKERTR